MLRALRDDRAIQNSGRCRRVTRLGVRSGDERQRLGWVVKIWRTSFVATMQGLVCETSQTCEPWLILIGSCGA